jgi:hypothetical protein
LLPRQTLIFQFATNKSLQALRGRRMKGIRDGVFGLTRLVQERATTGRERGTRALLPRQTLIFQFATNKSLQALRGRRMKGIRDGVFGLTRLVPSALREWRDAGGGKRGGTCWHRLRSSSDTMRPSLWRASDGVRLASGAAK